MDAVVAVYNDWGLGDGVTQPIVLSADRKHFKCLTDGAAVIVGRTTLADFPGGKPLKNRVNIVVTSQDLSIDGAEIAHSVEEALAKGNEYDRCLVIGGAQIYEEFLPYLSYVFVTKIDACPASTRFFPNLDADSRWTKSFESERFEEDGIFYTFCTYKRTDRNV